MKVLFYFDYSPEVGLGHFYRCLTLAKEIKRQYHGDIFFFCENKSGHLNTKVREKGFELAEQPIGNYDWLIFDSYKLSKNQHSEMRKHSKKIMVIDDLADRNVLGLWAQIDNRFRSESFFETPNNMQGQWQQKSLLA